MHAHANHQKFEKIISEVANHLLNNECSFFVGAGLSLIGGHQPDVETLKKRFVAKYIPEAIDAATVAAAGFPDVVEMYRTQCSEPDDSFVRRIHDDFLCNSTLGIKTDALPNTAHLVLASLAPSCVFTTNYDRSLETAFSALVPSFIVHSGREWPPDAIVTSSRIVKLFGTAGNASGPCDVLMLPSQFEQFERQCPAGAVALMSQALRGPLVYLGHSLRDDIVNQLLLRIRGKGNVAPSYCVSLSLDAGAKKYALDNNIVPISMNLLDFLYRVKLSYLRLVERRFEALQKDRIELETGMLRRFREELGSFPFTDAMSEIRTRCNDHRRSFQNRVAGVSHYDYRFHKSLYANFADHHAVIGFQRLYRMLSAVHASIQNRDTCEQHRCVVDFLEVHEFENAANAMRDHLEYVSREGAFWHRYFCLLADLPALRDTFRDYFIPLIDRHGDNVEQAFESDTRMILVGGPGTGKTTFLKIQLLQALARRDELPVFVDFDNECTAELFDEDSVGQFLITYLQILGVVLNDEQRTLIGRSMMEMNVFLIIDGLDLAGDAESRRKVMCGLQRYASQHTRLRVLVSTRPEVLDADMRATVPFSFKEITLPQSLSRIRVQDYVDRRGGPVSAIRDFIDRYHSMNFFLLDMLYSLAGADAGGRIKQNALDTNRPLMPRRVSQLYESYLEGRVQSPGSLEELARLAWNHVVNQIGIDELAGSIGDLNDLQQRYGTLIEVGREEGRIRFGRHPTIGEFLLAYHLRRMPAVEREPHITSLVTHPDRQTVVFFLAGLMDGPTDIVLRLLESDLRPMAIHCAGNVVSPPLSLILDLILITTEAYQLDGQIATPEVALALRPLGENAEDALSIFLEENYYDTLINEVGRTGASMLDRFLEATPSRMPHIGMLRRCAIDSLGALGTPNSVTLLKKALSSFTRILMKEESDKKEWMHNRWHVVIALAKSEERRAATSVLTKNVLKNSQFADDNIAMLEAFICVRRFGDGGTRANERLEQQLDKRIARSEADLTDNFKWRRAHTAEAIGRAAAINLPFRTKMKGRFAKLFDLMASEDCEPMVQHYANRALIDFVDLDAISALVDRGTDGDRAYWSRHGALNAAAAIMDTSATSAKPANVQTISHLRRWLIDCEAHFEDLAEPIRDLVVLGLRCLSRLGGIEDIPLVEKFAQKRQGCDLLSGNVFAVARNVVASLQSEGRRHVSSNASKIPVRQRSNSSDRILIIGAGVIGLTIADCLLNDGFRVSLIAERFGIETTSRIAGALWEWPPAVCGQFESTSSGWLDYAKRWASTTYHRFQRHTKDGVPGVSMRPVAFYFAAPLSGQKDELLKMKEVQTRTTGFRHDARLAAAHSIGPNAGVVDAYTYDSPQIDMDAYLPWLEARVRSRGGELHRRSLIGNIADIAGSLRNEFDAACVVQASGLGAESLGDRSMLPVRGALIQVVNNGKQFPKVSQAHCMSSGPLTGLGEFIFVVPKGDERLLLGGVAQPGERQLAIDVKDGVIAEMFERCSEFLPMLKDAEMVMAEPIRVGLRPFRRSGPRVELDPEAAICHCYGHGGAGVMLSWGCAEEVTRLVWKLLKR